MYVSVTLIAFSTSEEQFKNAKNFSLHFSQFDSKNIQKKKRQLLKILLKNS